MQRSPHGVGVSFEGGRRAKPFRARYFFNGPIDLGRFGSAEEAQRAHDQAVYSIQFKHCRATNFPPGTLTAYFENVDDRIRRHLTALGMESAYLAPATWLLNQPAVGEHAGPPAAPAPTAPAPAAAPSAPAPAPGTPTWVPAEAQAEVAAMQEQHGSGGQHGGLMHGLQHADMMMMEAESPAADMQPLSDSLSHLDVLLQADMEADSTDFAALLDDIFTDSAPMPDATQAAFGTAGKQQQVQMLLSTSTACPPAAVGGWGSSSATGVQQQFQVLGASAGSPPAATAAGPSHSGATSMQYDAQHRSQQQQWQHPVPGNPSLGSPAAHGTASMQQQNPGATPAACGSASLAQAAASEHSIAAAQLAPAAGAGFGAGVLSHAHAHAPAAAGAVFCPQQQQAAAIAALRSVDELMMFVDMSTSHFTQLYRVYTQQPSTGQQYAGLSTFTWGIGVRSGQLLPDIGHRDEPVVRVAAAVLHLCTTFMVTAAGRSMGPCSCVLLQPVVEQLLMALVDLRRLCTGAAEGLDSSSIMWAWWVQQQARAGTREGRVVLQLLGGLCGVTGL